MQGRKVVVLLLFPICLSPQWPWGFHKPWGHVAAWAQPCAPCTHVLARDICTNIPPRGWAGLWTQVAPSGLAVLLLAVITAGFLISFWAGNISPKRSRGVIPSHIHKQPCVHWQEGNHNICSPSPSNQFTSTFKPCLSFPDHEYPTAFSCLLWEAGFSPVTSACCKQKPDLKATGSDDTLKPASTDWRPSSSPLTPILWIMLNPVLSLCKLCFLRCQRLATEPGPKGLSEEPVRRLEGRMKRLRCHWHPLSSLPLSPLKKNIFRA